MDYRSAGVDIEAAVRAKQRIRDLVRSTFTSATVGDIGGFGGLFRFNARAYREPVLVASTDGVGTKLKVAFACGRHDTVGYDLVSHCINDILVQGARPLFFLDYLALGKLAPEVVESVVSGLVRACREFGLTLLGGETAEMPGFYLPGEYDLAGTIVGVVEQDKIIDGSGLLPGDCVIGLASTGLHTNGYSLARKILFEKERLTPQSFLPEVRATVGEALLAPHRCYLLLVERLLDRGLIKAMAHITGGGLTDNIPRVLPEGTSARIELGSWAIPPLFRHLREKGDIAEPEMLRTFNLGIGMVVMVARERFEEARSLLESAGETPHLIGEIVPGRREVSYGGTL